MSRSSKLFLLTLAFIALLWLLFPDLCSKFLFAGMLCFLLRPITDRLARRKWLPRSAASAITLALLFLLFAAAAIWMLPHLIRQLDSFGAEWEGCKAQLLTWRQKGEMLLSQFGIRLPADALFSPQTILQMVSSFLTSLLHTLSDGAAGLGFILISCFYLLTASDAQYQKLLDCIPPQISPYLYTVWHGTGKMLKGYLIGRISLAAFVGAFCGIGFALCGLEHAVLYAVILFLFDFVPYFGPFVGGVFPVLFALSEGGVFYALSILLVILAAQQLEESVIGVHIEANAVGVHPLAGIFSLLCCYRLFGITGLFLAMPFAGFLKLLYLTLSEPPGKIVLQGEKASK